MYCANLIDWSSFNRQESKIPLAMCKICSIGNEPTSLDSLARPQMPDWRRRTTSDVGKYGRTFFKNRRRGDLSQRFCQGGSKTRVPPQRHLESNIKPKRIKIGRLERQNGGTFSDLVFIGRGRYQSNSFWVEQRHCQPETTSGARTDWAPITPTWNFRRRFSS